MKRKERAMRVQIAEGRRSGIIAVKVDDPRFKNQTDQLTYPMWQFDRQTEMAAVQLRGVGDGWKEVVQRLQPSLLSGETLSLVGPPGILVCQLRRPDGSEPQAMKARRERVLSAIREVVAPEPIEVERTGSFMPLS